MDVHECKNIFNFPESFQLDILSFSLGPTNSTGSFSTSSLNSFSVETSASWAWSTTGLLSLLNVIVSVLCLSPHAWQQEEEHQQSEIDLKLKLEDREAGCVRKLRLGVLTWCGWPRLRGFVLSVLTALFVVQCPAKTLTTTDHQRQAASASTSPHQHCKPRNTDTSHRSPSYPHTQARGLALLLLSFSWKI